MSFVHGKGTAYSLNADDLSAYTNSITFSREVDSHDVTTFGKNSKVYNAGLKDGTAKIEGIYDNTATTGPGALFRGLLGGAAVNLVFRPEGAGVGKPNAVVPVIVTKYEEAAPVADMITFSAEVQFAGDVVDTTQ